MSNSMSNFIKSPITFCWNWTFRGMKFFTRQQMAKIVSSLLPGLDAQLKDKAQEQGRRKTQHRKTGNRSNYDSFGTTPRIIKFSTHVISSYLVCRSKFRNRRICAGERWRRLPLRGGMSGSWARRLVIPSSCSNFSFIPIPPAHTCH